MPAQFFWKDIHFLSFLRTSDRNTMFPPSPPPPSSDCHITKREGPHLVLRFQDEIGRRKVSKRRNSLYFSCTTLRGWKRRQLGLMQSQMKRQFANKLVLLIIAPLLWCNNKNGKFSRLPNPPSSRAPQQISQNWQRTVLGFLKRILSRSPYL